MAENSQGTPPSADGPNFLSSVIKGGLRSIASCVPALAPFGQAWSEYDSYRTNQRISELFENLQSNFTELNDRLKITEATVAACKEEFQPLLERTMDAVRTEVREDKRKKHAKLLARLAIDTDTLFDEKMALIEHLQAISILDIEVLRLFSTLNPCSIRGLPWRTLNIPGLDDNAKLRHLACSLSKLVAHGLLMVTQSHDGVVMIPDGLDKWMARWQETEYMILPAGQELLKALA